LRRRDFMLALAATIGSSRVARGAERIRTIGMLLSLALIAGQ